MSHQNVVELVEQAVRAEPRCAACASPTTVTSQATGLWLQCTSASRQRSFLERLRSLDIGQVHTRRHLLDAEVVAAA
jgi:ribosomal protein L37AE/L43A